MDNSTPFVLKGAVSFAFELLLVLVSAAQLSCNSRNTVQSGSVRVGTSLRVFELILNEIIGEPNQVVALVGDKQSPHAFHPRPSDAIEMHRANVIILGAPELDGWVSDMSELDPIYLADHLDPDDWIYKDGIRNPHFWVDPLIVKKLSEPLAEELCKIEPIRCDDFVRNAARFSAELGSLDERLRTIMDEFLGARVYTTQPFFDYFLRRYGVESAGSLEPIPGHEPPPSRIVRMLNSESESSSAGIIAQVRLPDVVARLFQAESGLPLVYLDPIGESSTDSYSTLLFQNATQLSTMLLDAE
ncbi:MAG: metal ABC transporter substrate-binding protein [Rhodothermia bacterium]|nr:MAG: metal ABC transporter substrate-binding protein [Rhodothermia bacterium]